MFTPGGISFHANMPSTFIQCCFGNPLVCGEIVRLPVMPKEYVTCAQDVHVYVFLTFVIGRYIMLHDGTQTISAQLS